jgi:hypothetical protein
MTTEEVKDKLEKLEIEKLAEKDHADGRQPFVTEHLDKDRKPCHECGGTGKCDCIACYKMNHGDCLFCNPCENIRKWRALPTWRDRLGPEPIGGAATHTPTQRYISYLG